MRGFILWVPAATPESAPHPPPEPRRGSAGHRGVASSACASARPRPTPPAVTSAVAAAAERTEDRPPLADRHARAAVLDLEHQPRPLPPHAAARYAGPRRRGCTCRRCRSGCQASAAPTRRPCAASRPRRGRRERPVPCPRCGSGPQASRTLPEQVADLNGVRFRRGRWFSSREKSSTLPTRRIRRSASACSVSMYSCAACPRAPGR